MENSNTAILIVDMQIDFLKPLANFADQVVAIQSLINFGKTKKMPCWYIEYANCGNTIPELGRPSHQSDFLIVKPSDSAFDYTNLDYRLKGWDIDKLIVSGVYASACVKSTVESALVRRLKVLTAKTLIGDETLRAYQDSLGWYHDNLGEDFHNNHHDLISTLI